MGVGDLLKRYFTECEQDDPGIIELLYRWYGRRVHQAAYHVLNDQRLAEDVVQETFLTAMSKLDTLRDPTKAEAWLVRTAINRSYELLRRHRRTASLNETSAALEQDTILGHLLDDEIKKEVLTALHLIPPINQEVVYYKFYRQLNCRQIAEILDVPGSTIRSRLKKALELIADYLGRETDKTDAEGSAGKETGENHRRGRQIT